jgi:hypothetical protein
VDSRINTHSGNDLASAQDPRDAFAFWAEHMRCGEFEAAWRISDRMRAEARSDDRRPRHFQSVWRGASLLGKRVLVRCHHGLGDSLQFIRYAPIVKALAAEVIVAAQPELIPLLQTMPAIDRLVPLDGTSEPPYDVDIEVMELPYALRTSPASIPAAVPYFHVAKSPLPAGDRLAVGIVWAAGDWDRRRSIPLPQLAPLASVADVKLFAFQRDAALGQTEHLRINHVNWRDVTHEAALLRALDLLISVDTMPAHLAGALGVPVWLLLHADADWRWMKEREDSPWYPTMRLFRQSHDGVWQPVLERVAASLRALTRAHLEAKQAGLHSIA